MNAATRIARARLLEYYQRTAEAYDAAHVRQGDEHSRALERVAQLADGLGLATFLDVGCGTGRAAAGLRRLLPGARVTGADLSPALLARARRRLGADEALVRGEAERLPFADESFDAACEFGVLHHVPEPARVVAEMCRVARRAVFLSDDNRYGRGPLPLRLVKVALARAGLWPLVVRLKTAGRGYALGEGDGVSYSYSVFDSRAQLERWPARVEVVPIPAGPAASLQPSRWPLLAAPHALLIAVRTEDAGGRG
jgi:ubiquinone/menaquinone biosynthesis C-methylase UbiE